VLKSEGKPNLSVYIVYKGKITHKHQVKETKVILHTFQEGDVIGDPLYHNNIFAKSELIASPNS